MDRKRKYSDTVDGGVNSKESTHHAKSSKYVHPIIHSKFFF